MDILEDGESVELLAPRFDRSTSTGHREGLRAELLPALGAAVLATVAGLWVLQLWKAKLQAPFVYGADSAFPLLIIKDIMTHGWDLTNPNLGAPFGQELYDYPATSGDSLYLVLLKLLGLPFNSPALVMNLFFLLGFPLTAAISYGVLRRLRITVASAVVCAVLYAVLPFRFDSSETHLFLTSYFFVPVCCYLILAVFDASELFTRDRRRSGLRAYMTWRSAAVVAVCLAVGSSDNYFALYTVALMAPAAILTFLSTRRVRPLICGLVATAIVLGAVVLNGLPTIIYTTEHGHDPSPDRREPQETELWGLSLATLVLPIEDNRIPWLAHLTGRYSATTLIPQPGPAAEPSWTNLGIVGTLGLLWLMVALAIRCVGGSGARAPDLRAPHAALAAGMAFLIGTVGGLATLFAYVVSPRLHTPARISVFIAFFALFGAALGLDRLRARVDPGNRQRMGVAAVFTIVLLAGVLVQTTPSMAPDYAATAVQYENQGAFIHAIEAQLPVDASLFQFPYVPFPEGADPGNIVENEAILGSLHSNRLRWSVGAIEGRPADWASHLVNVPIPQILEAVSAIGFQGLYVELNGLPGDGNEFTPIAQSVLGVRPLVSPERQYEFFNMSAYNRRLRELRTPAQLTALATATLYPTLAARAPG
jgi:hypothetical protein